MKDWQDYFLGILVGTCISFTVIFLVFVPDPPKDDTGHGYDYERINYIQKDFDEGFNQEEFNLERTKDNSQQIKEAEEFSEKIRRQVEKENEI